MQKTHNVQSRHMLSVDNGKSQHKLSVHNGLSHHRLLVHKEKTCRKHIEYDHRSHQNYGHDLGSGVELLPAVFVVLHRLIRSRLAVFIFVSHLFLHF